jgi:alpha-methylacyl-CoA racemase
VPDPAAPTTPGTGPLHGLRVVELAGLGAVPFAAMLLADLGADVVRVDRPAGPDSSPLATDPTRDVLNRGRRSVVVDLARPDGRDLVLRLAARSDVLLEGFRPGVTERLGLGPDDCAGVNPRLVYGRMTGWGQDGPLAATAGHDIDYIALTGVLRAVGRPPDRPVPPLNLLGDVGGGAMFLALGVVCAVLEARTSGRGQVVDAAMVDGTAVLTSLVWALKAQGRWDDDRGRNLLDSGAPFYEVYECADGEFIAVGALEPRFYAELVARTGLPPGPDQYDRATWPEQKERWAALFRTRPRDEWARLLEHTDACAAPVLRWDEAPAHPHLAARGTYLTIDGVTQPAPAPRFSRTPAGVPAAPVAPGRDGGEVLAELGLSPAQIAALVSAGVVGRT